MKKVFIGIGLIVFYFLGFFVSRHNDGSYPYLEAFVYGYGFPALAWLMWHIGVKK